MAYDTDEYAGDFICPTCGQRTKEPVSSGNDYAKARPYNLNGVDFDDGESWSEKQARLVPL